MRSMIAALIDLAETGEKTTAVFALRLQMKGHHIGNEERITSGSVLVGAEVADLLHGERTTELVAGEDDQLQVGHLGLFRVVLVDEVAVENTLSRLQVSFQFLDEWPLDDVLLDVVAIPLHLRCELPLALFQPLILQVVSPSIHHLRKLELPERTVVVQRALMSMDGSSVSDLARLEHSPKRGHRWYVIRLDAWRSRHLNLVQELSVRVVDHKNMIILVLLVPVERGLFAFFDGWLVPLESPPLRDPGKVQRIGVGLTQLELILLIEPLNLCCLHGLAH
jgi:hypothetical protein